MTTSHRVVTRNDLVVTKMTTIEKSGKKEEGAGAGTGVGVEIDLHGVIGAKRIIENGIVLRPRIGANSVVVAKAANGERIPGIGIIIVDQDIEMIGTPDGMIIVRVVIPVGMVQDVHEMVVGVQIANGVDFEMIRATDDKVIVFKNGGDNGRGSKVTQYIDPHATWRDQSQEYKRISRAKAEELARTMNLANEDPSFISLDVRIGSKSKPANDSDSEDSESNSEEDKAIGKKKIDYRDIHGKSVYKEDDEDLLQTTSDQEEEGAESAFDVLMRRRMMLDGELRKDPKQPEKWLEFIAVEDDIDLVSNRRSASAVLDHSTSHFEVKL
ncbi:hypothetical protein BGZ79_007656, partial [Entomortierella chlamydospora]